MDVDAARLAAWKSGDVRQGRALFESLFDELFLFFRNKCSAPEDMVQRTLTACIESADRFEGRSSFRVFVFSIAKNLLYSHWRAQGRVPPPADVGSMSVEALPPTPSRMLAYRDDRRRLAIALRQLALDDQTLLEGYYWQDLSGPELAQILAIGEPAVRSRLRRALARLRTVLESSAVGGARDDSLLTLDRWASRLRSRERDGRP